MTAENRPGLQDLLKSAPNSGVRRWLQEVFQPGLRTEISSGNRFTVVMQYTNEGAEITEHYAYALDAHVSRVGDEISPSEESMTPVRVDSYPIKVLQIFDRTRNRVIDVLSLLPEGFTAVALEPTKAFMEVRAQLIGMDPKGTAIKQLFSRGMPIEVGLEAKKLKVPTFRFYQDTPAKRDVFAEQLIIPIGRVRAGLIGIGALNRVIDTSERFLQQTLGGNLHLVRSQAENQKKGK